MQEKEFITRLFYGYLNRTNTPDETSQLFGLLENNRHDILLTRLIDESLANEDGAFSQPQENFNEIFSYITRQAVVPEDRTVIPDLKPVASLSIADTYLAPVHFLKTGWFRYAAILLLIAGAAMFLYVQNRPSVQTAVNHPLPDLPPGSNKAILTLADGSTIMLDSVSEGNLARQGSTSILKVNAGSLVYKAQQTLPDGKTLLYNTISTPRGGQYQIVLPDGSKVWLNAASSMRFPAVFAKTERRVEITGEAYLEVAQDTRKPFYVTAGAMNVQVLGTSFNIKNYSNETAVTTTLIDGSVRVSAYAKTSVLTPGQQVQAVTRSSLLTIGQANIEKTIAWKNGLFNFEDATLPEVMKQLERWYDIEVVYEKESPDLQFGGEMTRDITLNGLLTVLEKTGVHFRLEEGRRLVVLP